MGGYPEGKYEELDFKTAPPKETYNVEWLGNYVNTLQWKMVESELLAPYRCTQYIADPDIDDRRIYGIDNATGELNRWGGSISDPSSKLYHWERGRVLDETTGRWMQVPDKDETMQQKFDENGNPVYKDYKHKYNPKHSFLARAKDNSGQYTIVKSVMMGDPNDPEHGTPKDALLKLTEEKRCLFWGYWLKDLFNRRELVTPQRLLEVEAMVEALTIQTFSTKQPSQHRLAFLAAISRPGGVCAIPTLGDAIRAVKRQRELDARGVQSEKAAADADTALAAIQAVDSAHKFWWYYLTCYCMIINEPLAAYEPKGPPRTDGYAPTSWFSYGQPPLAPYNHTLKPLISRANVLEQSTYKLQYWFAQHLADSPVTQLAYGIPESCGRRSRIARFNPKLLRHDDFSNRARLKRDDGGKPVDGVNDHENFYFAEPDAERVVPTAEELRAYEQTITNASNAAYEEGKAAYLEAHSDDDAMEEKEKAERKAHEAGVKRATRTETLMRMDDELYKTNELVDLALPIPETMLSRANPIRSAAAEALVELKRQNPSAEAQFRARWQVESDTVFLVNRERAMHTARDDAIGALEKAEVARADAEREKERAQLVLERADTLEARMAVGGAQRFNQAKVAVEGAKAEEGAAADRVAEMEKASEDAEQRWDELKATSGYVQSKNAAKIEAAKRSFAGIDGAFGAYGQAGAVHDAYDRYAIDMDYMRDSSNLDELMSDDEVPPSNVRLQRLQAGYDRAVAAHPRLLYLFGDDDNEMNEQRYRQGLHDYDHKEGTLYRVVMWTPTTGTANKKLLTKARFGAFVNGVRSAPVVVDLYKPLPDRYATIKVGSLALQLLELQRGYWTAMNANPRFVYRQELRTYIFDPYMASPERLAEDCHYWACLENESMLESQTEMAKAVAENSFRDGSGGKAYWVDTVAYNRRSHAKAKKQSPPNQLPTEEPLLRYETKLKLEASAWEFKKTESDVRDEHPEMGPDVPDYFMSFRTDVEGAPQMEHCMAWTFFQVGAWYRDAEFRRTMFLVERGKPVGPAEGADWDYERYTTTEAGREEATESVHDYERRLDIEERERELEPVSEGELGTVSFNPHRRCPEHDLVNYDVSFSGRGPKIDEFDGTRENRPLTHSEFWEMQEGYQLYRKGLLKLAEETFNDEGELTDVSESDSEAEAEGAPAAPGVQPATMEEDDPLAGMYGGVVRGAIVRDKAPKRRTSEGKTYLGQTKQRRVQRANVVASEASKKRKAEPPFDPEELRAYEEANPPAMLRVLQRKAIVTKKMAAEEARRQRAARYSSVVDDAFRDLRLSESN
jgi:hypothetical protein